MMIVSFPCHPSSSFGVIPVAPSVSSQCPLLVIPVLDTGIQKT
ncbi:MULTISPECIES: hypothetical protein [unclassified Wolbachia]|nr:hypothetical protein [Wolbachia endosymbiont (group A) of Apoderus coryli]